MRGYPGYELFEGIPSRKQCIKSLEVVVLRHSLRLGWLVADNEGQAVISPITPFLAGIGHRKFQQACLPSQPLRELRRPKANPLDSFLPNSCLKSNYASCSPIELVLYVYRPRAVGAVAIRMAYELTARELSIREIHHRRDATGGP